MRVLRYVLAVLIVCASAAPALARSLDVCIDLAADARVSTATTAVSNGDLAGTTQPNFFVAAAPVFPGGTLGNSGLSQCPTQGSIGTFFTLGGLVAGLSPVTARDANFVLWHFRLDDGGAFDTAGPVKVGANGSTYPQTVIGSVNGAAPGNGKATVINLVPANAGSLLEFRISLDRGHDRGADD